MRFWKLRQAEYSPYTLQCSPLRVSRASPTQWPGSQPALHGARGRLCPDCTYTVATSCWPLWRWGSLTHCVGWHKLAAIGSQPLGEEEHRGVGCITKPPGYVLQVRQGELADPLYFDFIAFAQYATICAAFMEAPQVFQARTAKIPPRSFRHAANCVGGARLTLGCVGISDHS